jgi:hypothetical protein
MDMMRFVIFLDILRYHLDLETRESRENIFWNSVLLIKGKIDRTIGRLWEKFGFELGKYDEIDEDEYRSHRSCEVHARTDSETDRCCDPDISSCRESLGHHTISHDRTSTEKSYTRYDLSRYTSGISIGRFIHLWEEDRYNHEEA